MKTIFSSSSYFPYGIQISAAAWKALEVSGIVESLSTLPTPPDILFYRQLAERLNHREARNGLPVKSGSVRLFALMHKIFRSLLDEYLDHQQPSLEDNVLATAHFDFSTGPLSRVIDSFVRLYPPADPTGRRPVKPLLYLNQDNNALSRRRRVVRETLLLKLSMENQALSAFQLLFHDRQLAKSSPYKSVTSTLDSKFAKAPPCEPFDLPILELLRAPRRACPDSLTGQMEFIRDHWAAILPPELLEEMASAFDTVKEEERERRGGPGQTPVLKFIRASGKTGTAVGEEYPEPERFTQDKEWMPNVVLIAKMVYVWMDQLSRKYGRSINRLDEIPDSELDTLASWGFTGLWLIGLWERSPASRKIKQQCGNPEAISSAYSLYDYTIAEDLGGNEALENLRNRALFRGIRLASDMVPNHTGLDSKWIREHPEWFIQVEYPPYPSYRFEGPELSSSPDTSLKIEDGYWSRTDAAVVFRHRENKTGKTRYIYHGNDGTSTPWNDTAQLNYLLPEVREAVIQTIIHVARTFPIIRFDAAMTLAKKHYQRLWFPQHGLGGGIPSRAEHALSRTRFDELFPVEFWREVVDRIADEVPDTLLLAEAFWLMEGYFVRTLGMHRVYNSAFMNMLKMEENAKYRQTIKNVLEFNPEILQRFVNFMNNPDERTAVEQFGKEGKYFGAAVLMVTMPGLPMFGHGQIEGFTEKYGMEYRRAYWTEEIDHHLVETHERRIFPLMKKRRLFSGAGNFVLYDFLTESAVDENVFAYSNSHGTDRALIIFHNRFASTAGWIKTSSTRLVRSPSGETHHQRTTLKEALGVNPDGRFYYRFRDSASDSEYLRHGKELAEQGLFVKLEAYECQTFLDFREIRDDDYGTWGRLCRELAGRPVADLDREILRIRFSVTLAAFVRLFPVLLESAPSLFAPPTPGSVPGKTEAKLRDRLEEFLTALQREGNLSLDISHISEDVIQSALTFMKIPLLMRRGKESKEVREGINSILAPGKGYDNRILFLLYLLLRQVAHDAGGVFSEHPERVITEFALEQTTASLFRKTVVADAGAPPTPTGGSENQLLAIMLSHDAFFLKETKDALRMKELFADAEIRSFLLVHQSEGIEWFNKERFEELMQALSLTTLKTLLEKDSPEAGEVIRILGETQKQCSLAQKANYRTDRYPCPAE